MGNLIARVGGSGPRVQAHMDHVGYVVRHVAEDGFVLLDGSQGDRRSGPERQLPIGQPVKALTRHGTWLDGMIAASAGNVLTVAQRKEGQARLGRLLRRARARLTRGRARSRPAHRRARRLVPPMQRLADLLVGPSMDNRVGLALIDALLGTENLACEVWLGATAQEENGLHGARALALAERFALDVGLVGDIPSATRSGREPHGRLRPSRDDGMTTGTRSRKVPVFLDTSADGAENGAWRLWTDAHHGRAVLRSNLDIGLAWGLAWSIGIREEFEEPWLQNLADRKAFCQYVDVLWRGYPVIRERYLTVDGGRYVIPLPDQTFEHIDASSYALMPLTITWWSHALGHLIHSLSGAMYEYDRGLRHARVEVADETDAANGSRDRL